MHATCSSLDNLRLREDLYDSSGFLERHSMAAIDHVRLARVGGDDNEWHFHVGSPGLGCFLMSFQDIIDGRRFTKQVKIGV
jgi:hypothetical protein